MARCSGEHRSNKRFCCRQDRPAAARRRRRSCGNAHVAAHRGRRPAPSSLRPPASTLMHAAGQRQPNRLCARRAARRLRAGASSSRSSTPSSGWMSTRGTQGQNWNRWPAPTRNSARRSGARTWRCAAPVRAAAARPTGALRTARRRPRRRCSRSCTSRCSSATGGYSSRLERRVCMNRSTITRRRLWRRVWCSPLPLLGRCPPQRPSRSRHACRRSPRHRHRRRRRHRRCR